LFAARKRGERSDNVLKQIAATDVGPKRQRRGMFIELKKRRRSSVGAA